MNMQNVISFIFYILSGVFFVGGLYFNIFQGLKLEVWILYGVGLICLGLGTGINNYGKNIYLSVGGFGLSAIVGIVLIVRNFI